MPIFVGLASLATAWLMHEGRNFSFIADEWDWLLHRGGTAPHVFLRAHADHLTALPIAVYKGLFQVFGASSTVPFRLLEAVLAAGCAALVFVLVARRLGGWVALIPATILLFFGPGWSDILWSFQITYLGALVAGFGALLLVERGSAVADAVAALMLCAAVACSSLGVIMLAAAVVELVGSSYRRARWSRLWVVAVPIALYAAWYSVYGVSDLHLSRIHAVPLSTFDGVSAAAGAIVGLAQPAHNPFAVTLEPGTTIGILLMIAFGVRIVRGTPLSPRFWGMAAAILLFWAGDTLAYAAARGPEASRYSYPVAVFLIVAIAEFGSMWRPTRRAVVLLSIAAVAAIASNLGFLRDGAQVFASDSGFARAKLGAMAVARGLVAPSFSPASTSLGPFGSDYVLTPVTAGPYFAAVDKFGSQADDVPTILRRPEPLREAADLVLIKAERLSLQPQTRPGIACQSSRSNLGIVELVRGPGVLRIQAGASGASPILLRRLAANFSGRASLGSIGPRQTVMLSLPRDRSDIPWHVRLLTSSAVNVCAHG